MSTSNNSSSSGSTVSKVNITNNAQFNSSTSDSKLSNATKNDSMKSETKSNVNKSLSQNKVEAPTLGNISKQSKNTTSKNSQATNTIEQFETAKQAIGVYEVVSENYIILLALTLGIVIIGIIYFFSSSFRVGRAIETTQIYKQYQTLGSLDYIKQGERRLGDFYICSAYNAAHTGYQMYDYTSDEMVLAVLQCGARYLEFNVFNSEFGEQAFPVASMGWRSGEWKMMMNDIPMEKIFEIIAHNAFKITDGKEGCDNPDDPVFIGLNLNTNSNIDCLNLLGYLFTKYFSNRLLPNTYSFQNSDDIANIPIVQLMGKVIIFASDGFQGSGLEEIVNYCWDNPNKKATHRMQRLHYSELEKNGFDKNSLINYNRTGLTIIIPHMEGDFFNTNFNPILAIETGCQFIGFEFQYIDKNMDYYITRFRKKSFVLKNNDLRKGKRNITKPNTTNPNVTVPSTTPVVTVAINSNF
jgi:hypothetical protein